MSLEPLLNITQESLSFQNVIYNLLIGGMLGLVLQYHFRKFSLAFSSKKELGRILPFLVLIVCLIISIVKSSLALSLGLVGALSIVRFRTAIKEPEELVYLFMAIAIGLGLGANQTNLTVVASLAIMVFMALLRWRQIRDRSKSLFLTITSPGRLDKEAAAVAIKNHAKFGDLRKVAEGADRTTLIYNVLLRSEEELYQLTDQLHKLADGTEVTFIDNSKTSGL